ncbi:fumarate hydratase [Chloroflexota bacterium]
MRELHTDTITEAVADLCQQSNYYLPDDVLDALKRAQNEEQSPLGKEVLGKILKNADIAAQKQMPLCQDCGTVLVFIEIGQDVHIVGGSLDLAVEEGVRQGYADGYLRKSMVSSPFSYRTNTSDNTPPVVYTNIVAGDKLKIVVMPKGGGSENMTRFVAFTPAQGRAAIVDFVTDAVDKAGSSPCPPIIVGVGIGGTADKAMLLSKKALLRKVASPSSDAEVAELEQELLMEINALGIGPQGFGGIITAIAVHVEVFPAHIASLPVAVTLQCHSARHKEIVL